MTELMVQEKVCAVIVTYHPDPVVLGQLLTAILPQVGGVVVVDNGSPSPPASLLAVRGVPLLALAENLGVAAGFNRGIAWAAAQGFSQVLLLDQDSIPAPDMVARLATAMSILEGQGARVAAVGPRLCDAHSGQASGFARYGVVKFRYRAGAGADALVPAAFLISSGSLMRLATLTEVGGMAEELFIDLVDTEWFLRAAALGYRAYGVWGAVMTHRIGDHAVVIPAGRQGGHFIPTHSPLRHYYIFRNSMLLSRRPYVPWRWIFNNAVQLAGMLILFPLVSPPRLGHLRLMLKGLGDGLCGRSGRTGGGEE